MSREIVVAMEMWGAKSLMLVWMKWDFKGDGIWTSMQEVLVVEEIVAF